MQGRLRVCMGHILVNGDHCITTAWNDHMGGKSCVPLSAGIKCVCSGIYCNRVCMTVGEWEGSLNQTHCKDDVTVVLRHRFFLPPYCARWICMESKQTLSN